MSDCDANLLHLFSFRSCFTLLQISLKTLQFKITAVKGSICGSLILSLILILFRLLVLNTLSCITIPKNKGKYNLNQG